MQNWGRATRGGRFVDCADPIQNGRGQDEEARGSDHLVLRALDEATREAEREGDVEPILIVGRDSGEDVSVSEVLGRAGFPVEVATTAEAALVKSQRTARIPLVIINLTDPAIDWLTLALQIRSKHACELLAVVANESSEQQLEMLRHTYAD